MALCASASRGTLCTPSVSGSSSAAIASSRKQELRLPAAAADRNAGRLASASVFSLTHALRNCGVGAGRTVAWRPASFSVKAGKREEEVAEIRKLSDDDIKNNVQELKGELFILRAMQATRQEFKSSDFRKIRKKIARMLTVRRERELEDGVNKRESRKLDRAWQRSIVYRAPASYAAKLKELESKQQS